MKYFLFAVAIVFVFVLVILFTNDQSEIQTKPIETASTTPETVEAPSIPADIANHIKEKSDKIILQTPLPYAKISSPVKLQGVARGFWFFEASFPIYIVNWDGLIIGEGIATADGEWMTENFVPFTANITFTTDANAYSQNGSIILKKDNPSDLPENDDALEIPIQFAI